MVNVERDVPANGFSVPSEDTRPCSPHNPELQRKPMSADGDTNDNLSFSAVLDSPGCKPMDVYDATLPWWRALIRRRLLLAVERESVVISKIQECICTPWLDLYFVYTSALGTHTFFLTALPGLFFFGYDELGHSLLIVLGMGVYVSSFVKDLVCSPRPFAPPVTRMTISYHHLEYGFPSTHCTNSVSVALLFYHHIHLLAFPSPPSTAPAISLTTYFISVAALLLYTFSIVFGRLYTAMHSFSDCSMGALIGVGVWVLHWMFGAIVVNWIETTGWAVPATLVPLALIMVNQHPQPVDDCPCFEDAIAFVSVVLGSLLARWHAVHWGFDEGFFKSTMPGSSGETWRDVGVWWSVAVWKMFIGILIIFTWRIVAKTTFHIILPPIFRFLAQSFTLPNRRFYTPATDYKSVPSEFGHGGLLRPIPSVIDLPHDSELEFDAGVGSGRRGGAITGDVKLRRGVSEKEGTGEMDERGRVFELERSGPGNVYHVKHYDAVVLTKVIVYSGIAALSREGLPVMFELVGWGVKSW